MTSHIKPDDIAAPVDIRLVPAAGLTAAVCLLSPGLPPWVAHHVPLTLILGGLIAMIFMVSIRRRKRVGQWLLIVALACWLATPAALLLLLLLPAWWWWRRRNEPASIRFSRTGVLAAGPRRGRFVRRALFVMRNLVLVALVLALARPRTGARAETVLTEGINIVVAMDISSSMLAEDFQPANRLLGGDAGP